MGEEGTYDTAVYACWGDYLGGGEGEEGEEEEEGEEGV